jgi:hypothetical protein
MGEVTISAAFDSVGFKPYADSKDRDDRRLSQYAEPGDTVEMPDSEAERLGKLGAIEGVDAEDAAAAAPGITKPDQKAVDEPSVDEGRAGAPQFAGTPKDREILDDPQVDEAAADTESMSLSDLKVRDGSLYAEAERLGVQVGDDDTAAELRSKISEARDKAAASNDDS